MEREFRKFSLGNLQDCRFFPYSKGARPRKRKTHEPQTFSSFLHSLKTFRSNTARDARVRKKIRMLCNLIVNRDQQSLK